MAEKNPKYLTTFETAKLVGVDMGTVIDWCQQEKLQAFKTPGGHRRIEPRHLLDFLRRFKMPIPASLGQLAVLRCLVVDDEPQIRRIVSHVIQSIDPEADVQQAGDGFEAGTKLLENLPSLVVLDIGLPGINGLQVCRRIRSDSRFASTRILAITGNDAQENERKMRDAGADGFLAKPFGAKELKECLLKLLGKVDHEQENTSRRR